MFQPFSTPSAGVLVAVGVGVGMDGEGLGGGGWGVGGHGVWLFPVAGTQRLPYRAVFVALVQLEFWLSVGCGSSLSVSMVTIVVFGPLVASVVVG